MVLMLDFLTVNKDYFVIIHVLATVLGFGSALVSDYLFFKFLRDLKINQAESETLKSISDLVWLGFALLILSGLALFLVESEVLLASPKFQLKLVLVGIIFFNGLLFYHYISPKLTRMFQGHGGKIRRLLPVERRPAFLCGALSIVTWVTVFLIGSLRNIPGSFLDLFLIYSLFLGLAVGISLIIEAKLR